VEGKDGSTAQALYKYIWQPGTRSGIVQRNNRRKNPKAEKIESQGERTPIGSKKRRYREETYILDYIKDHSLQENGSQADLS